MDVIRVLTINQRASVKGTTEKYLVALSGKGKDREKELTWLLDGISVGGMRLVHKGQAF